MSKVIGLTGASVGCILGVLLLGAMTASSGARAADLVVRNARLIDGTGAPPRDAVSILVRDGVIRKIATTIGTLEGATVIDADGGTVIPGLIDCHVHL